MKNSLKNRARAVSLFLVGLLLFLPAGQVRVRALNASVGSDANEVRMVLPGGDPFGVELQTKGVLIVGTSAVDCPGKDVSPAAKADVKAGDILLSIDGVELKGAADAVRRIADSEGRTVRLSLSRQGMVRQVELTPVESESEHTWKAGMWVRDHTAGIGTVTYYIPETGGFSGLGHGICDSDTGVLMPLSRGSVMQVKISGIRKGAKGAPGELRGYFSSGKMGSLIGNTRCGVYGVLTRLPEYKKQDLIPIAAPAEIKEGEAIIRCTVDGNGIRDYHVKIIKLCGGEKNGKNFVLEITDPSLIQKTGGIVQGMSGSPVIQNGKLVGAVTHVLLDDPTRGYGIYIENVLAKMPKIIG